MELISDLIARPTTAPSCAPRPPSAELLARCERCIAGGGTAEEALWVLWSGTALAGSAAGAVRCRRRDRAVGPTATWTPICALFDIAHRSEEVSGLRGVTGFLAEVEGQQIPADTLGEADLRGSAVRLLTAHRAKGLEWDLVVVAGVQEGAWPDIRRRGSLLEPDRLGPHGLTEIEPTASRIAEERRLFYVACTRARRRLVVTAVAGTEGEGDQPSRFLTELGARVEAVAGRPRRPLTLAALVAELRRTCTDAETPPALREEAASRLARLADVVDEHGRPLVPTADPARWWGMRELSDSAAEVTAPEAAIALSGSQLAGLLGCPRQWFLSRKGQADPARSTAATFGSVIHVLADHGAKTDLPASELAGHLEQVWDQLSFDANWLSSVERAEAEAALDRFVSWQAARPEMELLGTEVRFRVLIDLGSDRVQLTGSADRVERDPQGRIRIVDFKTSRSAPQSADVAVQDQMGVYQLAVLAGAFDELAGPGARPGGAELVYLRLPELAAARCPSRSTRRRWTMCRGRPSTPTTDPTRATCRPVSSCSRPGSTVGWRWPHTWSAASGSWPDSAPAVGTARSPTAARPSRWDGRWCHECASTCRSGTVRGRSSPHPRTWRRRCRSRSPTSSWRRSPRRWSRG